MNSVELRNKPVFAEPDPTAKQKGQLVIALITIIFIIVLAYIIVTLYKEWKAPIVIQRCPVGVCAFDIITGIKRCPPVDSTKGIEVKYGVELCTSANYCQNLSYPCALLPDQTLDCFGVCGPNNDQCRCVKSPG